MRIGLQRVAVEKVGDGIERASHAHIDGGGRRVQSRVRHAERSLDQGQTLRRRNIHQTTGREECRRASRDHACAVQQGQGRQARHGDDGDARQREGHAHAPVRGSALLPDCGDGVRVEIDRNRTLLKHAAAQAAQEPVAHLWRNGRRPKSQEGEGRHFPGRAIHAKARAGITDLDFGGRCQRDFGTSQFQPIDHELARALDITRGKFGTIDDDGLLVGPLGAKDRPFHRPAIDLPGHVASGGRGHRACNGKTRVAGNEDGPIKIEAARDLVPRKGTVDLIDLNRFVILVIDKEKAGTRRDAATGL